MGLIPGKTESMEEIEKKYVFLDIIKFVYEEDFIKMKITTRVETDDSEIVFEMHYYDLTQEGKGHVTKSANSSTFEMQIPKNENKTLYEITIYKTLYPEYEKNYSFILQKNEEITESRTSINPIEINFAKNIKIYENYDIKNASDVNYFSILKGIELPSFSKDNIEIKKAELLIDVKCNFCERKDNYYKMDVLVDKGKIIVPDDLYFNFSKKEITKDNQYFAINGLAIPVETFNLVINYYGVGDALTNIKIENIYKNEKKIFGKCEESLFCFQ